MQGTGPALESLATYDTLVSWARGFEVLATSRNATLHSWQAALWALDCGLSTPPPPTAPPDAFAEFSLPEPSGTFFIRAPRHPLCAAIAFALLWHRADRGRNVSSAAAARRISCAEVAGSAAPAEPRRAGAVPGLDVEQEAHLSPASVLRRILGSLLGPEPLMHCCDSTLLRLLQFVRFFAPHHCAVF
jgi:hypothetical protein